VLASLPRDQHAALVVGMEHPDDAAVFRMPGGDLLVQTVDLIAPIVDNPVAFGQIAAANSLSDVYAMGGRPLTAMNIMCFPAKQLPLEVLREILEGALDRIREAGCALVGGHTVVDPELKFGLSVSGVVDDGEVWSIDRARVGDLLVLTKPIGTGVINQGLRKGKVGEDSPGYQQAVRSMIALNATGARAGRAAGASAVTDVTGFGLLGHAAQFARASRVTFDIEARAVPYFEGTRALVTDGVVPKRAGENADSYRSRVSGVASDEDAVLLFDPQTSGGLLACIPEEKLGVFTDALGDWPLGVAVIGRVVTAREHDVVVR
jgi:selenide, water dikinase